MDLFPDQKLDLPPCEYESPDWIQGFPNEARRVVPMVAALQRVKTMQVGLTEHVAAVRNLARWIEHLFVTSDAYYAAVAAEDDAIQHPPLESKVDLFCVHRGMRSNCVTLELFFQAREFIALMII